VTISVSACAALRALSLTATLLCAALLLAAPARAQAPAGTAESLDALEAALASAYTAEPIDPVALRSQFESLKVRQQRNFRIEAGLAMAEATIALRDEDEGAALRAKEAGEKASALNPDNRLARRAQGLGNLAFGRFSRRIRDRQAILEKAVKAFDIVADRPTPERWLDVYWKARALVNLGRGADAVKAAGQALVLLDEPEPGALGAGGVPRAKALVLWIKARGLATDGAMGAACETLRAALEIDPKDPVILAQLGLFLAQDGDPEEARAALDAALTAFEAEPASGSKRLRDDVRMAFARVEVARAATDTARALGAIEPLVATRTAHAEPIALRGALRRLAGDMVGAEADAADALRRDGFTVEALATRAEISLARSAPGAGTASASVRDALEAAETAAALEPRRARRHALLARALAAAGRSSDAEAAAARARALTDAAADGVVAPPALASRMAPALLEQERAEEALEAATRALAEDPLDGRAQVVLARAHLAIVPPRTAEARAAAAALTTRFPKVHDAFTIAALAALIANDAAGARAAAEQAIRLEPRDDAASRILTGATEGPAEGAGAVTRKLPPALLEASRRLSAQSPIVRADAALELAEDPAGIDLLIAQIERDPDPYVVGCLANALAAKKERRAASTLKRMYYALPEMQIIARSRVLRALGQVGDPAALPDVLSAILDGQGESGAGHAAVLSLMSGLDEQGAILFQRELVESPDPLRRALAPVLAEHLLEDKLAKVEADGRAPGGLLDIVRWSLSALLALTVYVRIRFLQKERTIEKLASAQHSRRHSRSGVMGPS